MTFSRFKPRQEEKFEPFFYSLWKTKSKGCLFNSFFECRQRNLIMTSAIAVIKWKQNQNSCFWLIGREKRFDFARSQIESLSDTTYSLIWSHFSKFRQLSYNFYHPLVSDYISSIHHAGHVSIHPTSKVRKSRARLCLGVVFGIRCWRNSTYWRNKIKKITSKL